MLDVFINPFQLQRGCLGTTGDVIPELDEQFWADAKLVEPDTTQHVILQIKKSVLEHFETNGAKGYKPRISAVLESYMRAQKRRDRDQHRDH